MSTFPKRSDLWAESQTCLQVCKPNIQAQVTTPRFFGIRQGNLLQKVSSKSLGDFDSLEASDGDIIDYAAYLTRRPSKSTDTDSCPGVL